MRRTPEDEVTIFPRPKLLNPKIIIIMDLYSAFRSEDKEALDAAQD